MANLSLKHIYKIYDNGTKAVDDFNLEIDGNEFIVFVGPSGCGKSTTLRMIAGLEDITAGEFFIDGVLQNSVEPKDRDMAMVFQNYALYPHMTVYENMAFGLRIRHVPKDEIDRRVLEAAKILDIENQLTKKPKAMSGGQKQRVALGRAIVRQPKVFLLDEPLSNLDAKLRSSMRSEITKLHNVLQTTFIYVTHDQVEAMTMGTKIVVMKLGVIQQVDTPMNLYDYPANEFVAGFIGTPQMNFFDAKLGLDKTGYSLKSTFKDFVLDYKQFNKLDVINAINNKDVVVGIRPEHILLADKSDKDAFECEVVVVEALGNECNLIVETIKDHVKLTLRTIRNDQMARGDKIFAKFDYSKIHLFDKETTNTLMPKIPEVVTVKGEVSGSTIKLFGSSLAIDKDFASKFGSHKKVFVTIPKEAIVEGKTFTGKLINKQKIGKEWLHTIENGDESIFLNSNEYISGDTHSFDLLLSKLKFYDENGKLIVDCLNETNLLDGYLKPCSKILPVLDGNLLDSKTYASIAKNGFVDNDGKKVKVKQKKFNVFNYCVMGQEIIPSDDSVCKIYLLLGKKFGLHTIKFSVNSHDIKFSSNGNFEGTIVDSINYDKEKYYYVQFAEQTLLVAADGHEYKDGETVRVLIDESVIGVEDVNFGVKIL